MKFLLTRTSHEMDWDEDDVKCPLDEKELLALRVNLSHEKFDVIDRRSVADPADIPAHHGEDTCWWYQSGENHTVVNGYIQRTFRNHADGFFIEIPSMDLLIKLESLLGKLVLHKNYSNPSIMEIEIYDTWRE
jgi:hypothetical protein